MESTALLNFEIVMTEIANEDCSLLLGNGFSIDYFNDKNLLSQSGLSADSPILSLFELLKTFDFEYVMRCLEEASLVAEAYADQPRAIELKRDADTLRDALITSIRSTHPLNKTSLGNKPAFCIEFVTRFGKIFTLNYDLLLYWVRLEKPFAFADGFGLGERRGNFQGPFKEGAYCNVYNLHGGLHLFKTPTLDVEKCISTSDDIITEIENVIRSQKRMPLYVAEGTSKQKLAKINETPYLRHCLKELKSLSGNLFIYGHSASQNDEHVYEAIFSSKAHRIFFCVHTPTTDINHIRGELERYKARLCSNIEIKYVDAETVPVWPNNS